MDEIEVAVVILFDDQGRMLVNRRPDDGYFGGWWEWPGGKREPGEDLEECARRELREEIGMEAGPLTEYDRRRVAYPGRIVNLVFFVGRPASGSSAHNRALQHAWMAPAEVKSLRFLEPNLPVLEKLAHAPPRLG